MSQILKFTVWFFKSTVVLSSLSVLQFKQQLAASLCNECASEVVRTFLTSILLTVRKVETGT